MGCTDIYCAWRQAGGQLSGNGDVHRVYIKHHIICRRMLRTQPPLVTILDSIGVLLRVMRALVVRGLAGLAGLAVPPPGFGQFTEAGLGLACLLCFLVAATFL
jgi:hypothetical protein